MLEQDGHFDASAASMQKVPDTSTHLSEAISAMVDMHHPMPPAFSIAELLKGDEEQALDPDLAPEPEPEAGPDFPDEPACEGRVNDPKLTKGPDGHRGQAEGGFAQPSGHLLEILVPPG